ncbi:MAG TPA: hypothetical protein VKQ06_02015 [Gammaproteobacteria bacterium]|nr:hypothetical protein [Gammaproteobacteria bacterium]
MKILSQRNLTNTLIACCALFAGVVALEALYPFEAPPAEATVSEGVIPEATALPAFAARPLKEFDQVLARPLFFEDRRLPAQLLEQPPEPVRLEPLRLTLEGVAIGGGSRVAVLHDEREREQILLAEGMTHNGWVLESVKSAGAEFRRGSDITRLELEIGEDSRRRRR